MLFSQLFLSFGALGQQPGGVEGTKLWYVTVKKGNNYFLRDTSGNIYSLANQNTSRNINFHPAYFLSRENVPRKVRSFENFSFNQATVVGAFFPAADTSGLQDYFQVKSLGRTITFRSNQVVGTRRYSFGNILNRTTLSVRGVTKQEDAMKTGVYYFASGKNYYSTWGEDKQTDFLTNFDGYLPELIIYNRVLTPLERTQVESYLSIKYGTTLDTSYIGRNGRILWNIHDTVLKKFHHRVCAIGKDTLAGIFQPKSNTTYEEAFGGITSFNKDANDSTIKPEWPYIPGGEEPSLYRSVTMGFTDKTLKTVENGRYIFWGDNALSVDSVQFRERYRTQYPELRTVERDWLIFNPGRLTNSLRVVISGGDYNEETLYNTLYDPYDYQLYRFVIIRKNRANASRIEKPILCSYFGREQSSVSLRFKTRAIIWDSLFFDHESGYNFITFGKVHILNFLMVHNQFNNVNKKLEYPYYQDSAIRAETNFDTTVLVFNYVNGDSTLKFSFKTSVGVGDLKAKIYLVRSNGDRIPLPASFIVNNQVSIDSSTDESRRVADEDVNFEIKPPDEDNPSGSAEGPRAKIKYIKRTVPADKQKFKEFKIRIPLKSGLNLDNRFLIEVTDDIGQKTTLPLKIRKPN